MELTIQALENRFSLIEVPIDCRQRPAGSFSKLKTFQDGFLILYTILKMFKDYKPITFCWSLTLVAVLAATWTYLNRGLTPLITPLLNLATIAFFSGLILNALSQRSKGLYQLMARQNARPKQSSEQQTDLLAEPLNAKIRKC